MARIAVAEMARLQVKDTNEHCYEHVHLVAVAHRLIQGLGNDMWFWNMGRDIAEQRTCHSHEHRGRNTLTTDIAHAEEELLVTDIEVEEVTTNGSGRCQLAVDINIVALRIWWERLGQHRHLDAMGNVQLALDSCFLGSGGLQFLHILCQRLLHLFEGVAQLVYLVATLHGWQRSFEITLGHIVGRQRQQSDRQRGFPYRITPRNHHHQQTNNDKEKH